MNLSYQVAAVFPFTNYDSYHSRLHAVYAVAGEDLKHVDEISHYSEEAEDSPLHEIIYELPTEAEAHALKEKFDAIDDVISNVTRVTNF